MTIPSPLWHRWRALLLFNLMYLGRPPWDTGITPPEVIEVIEGGIVAPGRAIDLGCGTGTNAIYLARRGFDVIGVDSAVLAILKARRKAHRAGVHVRFRLGPVTRLDFLPWPADFALDIGCLHGLWPTDHLAYAAALARAVRPGGHYLLYAWGNRGWAGLDPPEVAALFGSAFEAIWVRTGAEHGVPSSWYLMERRHMPVPWPDHRLRAGWPTGQGERLPRPPSLSQEDRKHGKRCEQAKSGGRPG